MFTSCLTPLSLSLKHKCPEEQGAEKSPSLKFELFVLAVCDSQTGGEYDGLYAMMVCRVVLGRAFVTEKAGDFSDKVKSGDYEYVLGDREKVETRSPITSPAGLFQTKNSLQPHVCGGHTVLL